MATSAWGAFSGSGWVQANSRLLLGWTLKRGHHGPERRTRSHNAQETMDRHVGGSGRASREEQEENCPQDSGQLRPPRGMRLAWARLPPNLEGPPRRWPEGGQDPLGSRLQGPVSPRVTLHAPRSPGDELGRGQRARTQPSRTRGLEPVSRPGAQSPEQPNGTTLALILAAPSFAGRITLLNTDQT